MSFISSKLAEVVDFQADFAALPNKDNDIQIPNDKQEMQKCLLHDWNRFIDDEISKQKALKNINIMLQQHNVLASKKEELQKALEEKMKVKNLTDNKKAFYDKLLNLYRKNLGFHMDTIGGSEESDITFVFTNINKKNPQETFSISLIVDVLEYKVTSCQPMIDSLDELVTVLCESNDLEKFILQVRHKFCMLSTTNYNK